MKNNLRRLVSLALFVLALTGAALAQDFGYKVRANIPFNFYAGGKLLPAGIYTLSIDNANHVVAIGKNRKGIDAFVLGSPNDHSRNGIALLTFHTAGEGTYALQKVVGQDFGVSFSSSKVLSDLAAHQQTDATQTVTAALLK